MKDIRSYLLNFDAASSGYSFGKLRDNPGNDTGSAVTCKTQNDFLYAFYAFIKKYGTVSDTDESETASDFVDAFEAVAVLLTGAQTIAGLKTFSDGIAADVTGNADTADGINETGSAAGVMHFKTVQIGVWDMDTNETVAVTHDLDDSKIRTVDVIIYADGSHLARPLFYGSGDGHAGGYYNIYSNGPSIILTRVAGGIFDNTSYNDGTMNRGFITFGYID